MTTEEAKDCLNFGTRIFYENKEFFRIRALCFRKDRGKFSVFAELLDKNKNSIYSVPIEFLKKEETKTNLETEDHSVLIEKNSEIKECFCNFLNTLENLNVDLTLKNIERIILKFNEISKELEKIKK